MLSVPGRATSRAIQRPESANERAKLEQTPLGSTENRGPVRQGTVNNRKVLDTCLFAVKTLAKEGMRTLEDEDEIKTVA